MTQKRDRDEIAFELIDSKPATKEEYESYCKKVALAQRQFFKEINRRPKKCCPKDKKASSKKRKSKGKTQKRKINN